MQRAASAVYLHGFASSPASSKAARFAKELAAAGIPFACPDLNESDFSTLTVTRMLEKTREVVATSPAPVTLIGSSLGAFVALHAAALDNTGTIDRLILMAPALDFGGNRLHQLGAVGIDEWRQSGTLRVQHYAFGEPRDVGFALYEDAARYDAMTMHLAQPILIFQGRHDDAVDPHMVEHWAMARQPNVTLRKLDDDHQLTASIDFIWRESARFLGLRD
jgi:pimeloyl-ACP methyl ester carboxylesterase